MDRNKGSRKKLSKRQILLIAAVALAAVLLLSGRADPLAVLSRAARELIVSLPLLLVCHPAFLFLHRRFTL